MISNVLYYVVLQVLFVLLMLILHKFICDDDGDISPWGYKTFVLFPWQVFCAACSVKISIEFFERIVNGN